MYHAGTVADDLSHLALGPPRAGWMLLPLVSFLLLSLPTSPNSSTPKRAGSFHRWASQPAPPSPPLSRVAAPGGLSTTCVREPCTCIASETSFNRTAVRIRERESVCLPVAQQELQPPTRFPKVSPGVWEQQDGNGQAWGQGSSYKRGRKNGNGKDKVPRCG